MLTFSNALCFEELNNVSFRMKIFNFTAKKLCVLHRRVFVMNIIFTSLL